eukprot:Phypoly_transcript_20215.p1 GENE.Phypoly_transcript_20215~~Phypoly_transcript_20215.p1  ORF type:complete len:150 (+),score=18.79 Phypoly_transcript_20215:37-450(+)
MGELQKSGMQLMIRHYEIGVLFVPSLYSRGKGPNPKFVSMQGYLSANKPTTTQTTTQSTTQTTTQTTTSSQNNKPSQSTTSQTTSSQTSLPQTTTSALVGFPLPYTLPPKLYSAPDLPWLWDVPHNKQDLYGKKWLC